MVKAKTRVGIIGAGPSGLALLGAFVNKKKESEEAVELVCYEKQYTWGGQWILEEPTKEGVAHSSMYKNLWTNTPKECQEIPDYTYDTHFGGAVSSYLDRVEAGGYMIARAVSKNLRPYIHFNHAVTDVTYDDASSTFTMKVKDGKSGDVKEDKVDYLVVASGHFSEPNMITIEGQDSFTGKIMHAHSYRDGREFKGKHVLCVGAHYSGEDISLQCVKFGASQATVAHHTAPTGHTWPSTVTERPNVTKIDGATVHFKDGSTATPDAIILCTGYIHHYPFLSKALQLNVPNTLYPPHLYKGVVFQENDRVFYLGAQDQIFSFPMFDAQTAYVRDIILGSKTVPAADERQKDIDAWLANLGKIASLNDAVDFQANHVGELMGMADYTPSKGYDVHKQGQVFKDWLVDKAKEVAKMRDLSYKSSITGTLGAPYKTTWDDDMRVEEYEKANAHLEK